MLRFIFFVTTLVCSFLASMLHPVWANDVAAANQARLHSCRSRLTRENRLRENRRLDEAARRISQGDTLQNATKRAGYRSFTSAAVQITNVPNDREVEGMLTRRFCEQITSPDLKDIGTYRSGPNVWLVVASPFSPPSPGNSKAVSRRVLQLTNEARAKPRRCGNETFPAAPPLILAPATLERAARDHSQDMANHNYLDHTGRDGSRPNDRVNRAGYAWQHIGENLALGEMTPEDVVSGWMGSPHHCENIMTAKFTEMAVAYSITPDGGNIYWTQLFGTPPAARGPRH